MQDIIKILLAGEGGQGIQSIAEILAEAANHSQKEALYIPNFGVEQRGGISMAYLQITDSGKKIGAPKFELADFLIALSSRALSRTRHHAGKDTVYIYDNSLIEPAQVNDEIIGIQYFESTPPCPISREEVKVGEEDLGDNRSCNFYHRNEVSEKKIPRNVKHILSFPANDIAKNELTPRVFNIMILGVVAAAINIVPLAAIEQALENKLAAKYKKNGSLRELNNKALIRGYELMSTLFKGETNG
ncbi:hypothetical protein P22_2939 [Propionispora sp. 2/2-37]|uniref:2-oxoacid:acceptor oxidoreductase family protein n=1 Tax=Propionispora sp. 2/2-37 TaxID=1677858 RepID=UPI0006BB960F|nr:2-oxoacid:acceptor oxidoreductase family protein [Propionispora sp. 2/2-37]CUH96828.1 hypothetical protein P22_2939 [Propionispora sp. 2/2-37]